MVQHFLSRNTHSAQCPTLSPEYNKQPPEGSPQARRATGWLFVTKCSRLNADITVISSATNRDAKPGAKAE